MHINKLATHTVALLLIIPLIGCVDEHDVIYRTDAPMQVQPYIEPPRNAIYPAQQQGSTIDKQDIGTVLGGIGGGVAGAQFGKGKGKIASTVAGVLLGGVIGNQIGSSLDRADMAYNDRTSQAALETNPIGQPMSWSNPSSGNSGTITPTSTFQQPSGQPCREYTQRIIIAGKAQQGYGKACRQPDGSWQTH